MKTLEDILEDTLTDVVEAAAKTCDHGAVGVLGQHEACERCTMAALDAFWDQVEGKRPRPRLVLIQGGKA